MKLRAVVVVVVCLSIVTAGAAAASASAAVWKDKGVNVTKLFQLGLSGSETVEVNAGGPGWINCQLHANLSSFGGSGGQITAWEQNNCGGSGTLAGCLFVPEAKFLPWSITVNAADLSVGAGAVKFTAVKFPCPIFEVVSSVTGMTMTPDSTTAISEFGFFASSGVSGLVRVDSPNSGTYGIG